MQLTRNGVRRHLQHVLQLQMLLLLELVVMVKMMRIVMLLVAALQVWLLAVLLLWGALRPTLVLASCLRAWRCA
jgi:uncharacterized membrane protein